MAPLQAAYKHAPRLPQPGPDDPGPFSFASEQRVVGILSEAGFTAVEIGPAARALEGQPPDVIAAATHSIREVLSPFASGQQVPLAASFWMVTARGP